jgi:hypothetical protein
MRYTVRNTYGELVMPSRQELQRAFELGLVDAEDEVLEEGSQEWRKAGTMAGLRERTSRAAPGPLGAHRKHVALLCALALTALALLLSGTPQLAMMGALLAFLTVSWLFGLTRKAMAVRRRA